MVQKGLRYSLSFVFRLSTVIIDVPSMQIKAYNLIDLFKMKTKPNFLDFYIKTGLIILFTGE